MRSACFILLFFSCITLLGQATTDPFLKKILEENKDSIFQQVINDPQTYRLQIIYTEIDKDKHNKPTFKNYYYNYDPDFYFNPASTVKLPLALLSLEKLNGMHIHGVNKYTSIQFDSSYEKQSALYKDTSSSNKLPSIAQFIRKAFLVSDNDAYNRFYQFTGQQDINRCLHAKGYEDVRITRQFMGFTPEQNRHTNQIRFIDEKGDLIYLQPAAYNRDSFYFPPPIKIGKAHYDQTDSLVNEPIDFTKANNISLKDLQQILQSVLFPSSVPASQRFKLNKDDYRFVYRYLSQYPSETNYPKYDTSKFYDSNVKFYFKYGSHQMPMGVRVFNKVGWAYGFLTDVSYVADFKNNVEFMLSATVYVNSDGVLNDDKYDYDSIGYPFLFQLGQTIYHYELQRIRDHKPDLSKFIIQYEHRDANDNRPIIKDVDN
ncbi:MAG: serine hydrolase [Chitinophagales bacterium]